MSKNEYGFAGVLPIVLIAILLSVGAFGIWRYQDSRKAADTNQLSQPTIPSQQNIPSDNPEPLTSPEDPLPKGYVRYTDKKAGFSFAYPKKWGSITAREDFNFNKQSLGILGGLGEFGSLEFGFGALTGNPHDGTDNPVFVYGLTGITKKGSNYILANNRVANNFDDFKYTRTELGHAVQFSFPDAVGAGTTQVTAIANLDGSTKYKYLGFNLGGPDLSTAERHKYLSTILSTLQAD